MNGWYRVSETLPKVGSYITIVTNLDLPYEALYLIIDGSTIWQTHDKFAIGEKPLFWKYRYIVSTLREKTFESKLNNTKLCQLEKRR